MELLKPNKNRADLARYVYILLIFLSALNLIFDYQVLYFFQELNVGANIPAERLKANENARTFLAIVNLVASLASILFMVMWFRRAYWNLHQIFDGLRFSEGWAAGAWFVPIIFLYRPYQIMKEMFEETRFFLKENNHPGEANVLTYSRVNWWWAVFIINNMFQFVLFRYILTYNNADAVYNDTIMQMIAEILDIASVYLTMNMIKTYNKAEMLLPELWSSDAIPPQESLPELSNNPDILE
jgi:hypothetical protein